MIVVVFHSRSGPLYTLPRIGIGHGGEAARAHQSSGLAAARRRMAAKTQRNKNTTTANSPPNQRVTKNSRRKRATGHLQTTNWRISGRRTTSQTNKTATKRRTSEMNAPKPVGSPWSWPSRSNQPAAVVVIVLLPGRALSSGIRITNEPRRTYPYALGLQQSHLRL